MLLQEQAIAYNEMSDLDLIDAYNQAQENYYKMYNTQKTFQNQMVTNAQQFYDSNMDITRPFLKWEDYDVKLENEKDLAYAQKKYPNRNYKMGDTVPAVKSKQKVYLPGLNGGTYMNRKDFSNLVFAIKKGKSFKYDGKTYTGDEIHDTFLGGTEWGMDANGDFRMATTDNTCAAFTCAILDKTDADMKVQDADSNIVFLDHKNRNWSNNLTADEWNTILGNQ